MQKKGLNEAKLLWVCGALERLATLGFIGETPYKVSQDTIDLFLHLDENRNKLFPDNTELKYILESILNEINGESDEDTLNGFYVLLTDYKDNREKIVKYSLEHVLFNS
jgi:hypothetical protein